MKIAVTYDNGNIFQHFGKTEFFKVYEVEDGKVEPVLWMRPRRPWRKRAWSCAPGPKETRTERWRLI